MADPVRRQLPRVFGFPGDSQPCDSTPGHPTRHINWQFFVLAQSLASCAEVSTTAGCPEEAQHFPMPGLRAGNTQGEPRKKHGRARIGEVEDLPQEAPKNTNWKDRIEMNTLSFL
jgi:hypothetical protein